MRRFANGTTIYFERERSHLVNHKRIPFGLVCSGMVLYPWATELESVAEKSVDKIHCLGDVDTCQIIAQTVIE